MGHCRVRRFLLCVFTLNRDHALMQASVRTALCARSHDLTKEPTFTTRLPPATIDGET
jgi:hypothetical protein